MLPDNSTESLCRLCMSVKGTFIPIFDANQSESTTPSLLEKISQCTEVQIQEEYGLPNSICHHCLYQIEIWFSFKQLCVRTNNFLHEEVQKTNIVMMTSSFSESQLIEESCLAPNLDWGNERISRETTKHVPKELNLSPPYNFSKCGQFVSAPPTRVYSRLRKDLCHICKTKFMNKEDLDYHMSHAHNNSTVEASGILHCSDSVTPFNDHAEYDKACSGASAVLHSDTQEDFTSTAFKASNDAPVVILHNTQEGFQSSPAVCSSEKSCNDTPAVILEHPQENYDTPSALCSSEKACNNTSVLLLNNTQANFLNSSPLCSADKTLNDTPVLLIENPQENFENSTFCPINNSCNDTSSALLKDDEEALKCSAAPIITDVVQTATIVLDAASLKAVVEKREKETSSKLLSQLSLKYKKANLYPCPFCGTFIQRISRHIETQHSNEIDVKKLMGLKKKSVDRIRLLEQLRMQGIIKHNRRTKDSKKRKTCSDVEDSATFSKTE